MRAKPKKKETKAEHLHRYRRATRWHVITCDICCMHRNGYKAPTGKVTIERVRAKVAR